MRFFSAIYFLPAFNHTMSDTDAPASTIDTSLLKVHKHIQQLRERVNKLTVDNKKLKDQLVSARSTSSRIRRIPKTTGEPAAES